LARLVYQPRVAQVAVVERAEVVRQVSVIVPARGVTAELERCLESLRATSPAPAEVIVVLDGCPDEALESRFAVQVIALPRRHGPAVARNVGARRASGEILFFVDADVVVPPHAIGQVVSGFAREPAAVALFGSYDDEPSATNLVSQYKNLLHHHVHQSGHRDASTFWSGCGAIDREVFLRAGGFDERIERASIEDIELGRRLVAAGLSVRLLPDLQVKHQKRYTLVSLVRSDVIDRALPWTRLILRERHLPNDLNLAVSSRMSAGLLCAALACAAGALLEPWLWIAVTGFLAIQLFLDRRFHLLVLRKRGLRTTVGAVLLHWLYYFYSTLTFSFCVLQHLAGAVRSRLAQLSRQARSADRVEPEMH
jgi:GT2 family glycosyltransferase